MKRIVKFMLKTSAVVLGITLGSIQLYGVSYAQDRAGESGTLERERAFDERSNLLRRISEAKPKPPAAGPRSADVLKQAREDFMAIQVINKSLKQAVAKNALDLDYVSNSMSEVRKRAQRLNTNLALPKEEKAAERQKVNAVTNAEELKSSILHLSKLIQSFVTNPCFKDLSVVDTQLTSKARLDLEDIIEISKQLQKDSEKLEKAARKKNS